MKINKSNAKERIRTPSYGLAAYSYDLTQNGTKIVHIMQDDINDKCILLSVLKKALLTLEMSPAASVFIKEAMLQNWRVKIENLDGVEYSLDIKNKYISLDHEGLSGETLLTSEYFSNAILIALAKALRDVWHEKRHISMDGIFSADAILLLERVRAADCDTVAILIAWELRSEGLSHVWRYMLGSDLGDMAMIFANTLERNPSAHFSHNALQETFKQWYADEERVIGCDHQSLNYMDELLNHKGREVFGRKMPTHIAIELISTLPDKSCYLQTMGQDILRNKKYFGLQDPLNQAYYSHIMHDIEATIIQNVAFRDSQLAHKIFPSCIDILCDDSEHVD